MGLESSPLLRVFWEREESQYSSSWPQADATRLLDPQPPCLFREMKIPQLILVRGLLSPKADNQGLSF